MVRGSVGVVRVVVGGGTVSGGLGEGPGGGMRIVVNVGCLVVVDIVFGECEGGVSRRCGGSW